MTLMSIPQESNLEKMDPAAWAVGQRIAGLRRAAKMNQQMLGEKLGFSRQSVSSWESGKSYPPAQALVPLADLFSVTIDFLLRGPGHIVHDQGLWKDQLSANRADDLSIAMGEPFWMLSESVMVISHAKATRLMGELARHKDQLFGDGRTKQ